MVWKIDVGHSSCDITEDSAKAFASLRVLTDRVAEILDPVSVVGGAVRDALLGRAATDVDMATPLTPDEMVERLRAAGRRPFIKNRRAGTIGFKVEGDVVEITTFRSVSYEGGCSRPEVTLLESLVDDLSHRDFTVNAMAVHGTELLDPWDGLSDLSSRTLRAVGSPKARFREDPVRLLRAARLVSQLGFTVDEATARAVCRDAHRVLDSAKERWIPELDKLLLGDHVVEGLGFLASSGVMRFVLPELQLQVDYDQDSPYHDRSLFSHTCAVVAAVPAEDVNLRWAALLHDVGKPYVRVDKPGRATYVHHEQLGAELVKRIGLHMAWSKARREAVSSMVIQHMGQHSPLKCADDGAKRV